jgi:hypothetical protein
LLEVVAVAAGPIEGLCQHFVRVMACAVQRRRLTSG